MKTMKSGLLIVFVTGIATLAILSYNVSAIYAHGGGNHHGEYAHEHHDGSGEMHDGGGEVNNGKEYAHYHHDHEDYGDHYRNGRNIPGGRPQGAGYNILTEQECQNHGGEWEGN